MRRLPLLLAPLVVLFASCGSDLAIVSKDRAASGGFLSHGGRGMSYHPATPSGSLMAQGRALPKDKHGMPLYSRERVRVVRTTAYTCSEDDHLEYGSMNASGTPLRYSDRVRSAAADWSVYPVGTTFKIKGMPHLYVVDDYGSALLGTGTVDLYKPSKQHMNAWGRRTVELAVVRWGSYERSANILSGRLGYSHCRQMYAAIQRKTGGSHTAMR